MVWGRGATARLEVRGVCRKKAMPTRWLRRFGEDFSKMLVTGSTPFGGSPTIPPAESLGPLFGGAHKYPACEAFGRFPGLVGVLGRSNGAACWMDRQEGQRQAR